jgi:hypothetical protein
VVIATGCVGGVGLAAAHLDLRFVLVLGYQAVISRVEAFLISVTASPMETFHLPLHSVSCKAYVHRFTTEFVPIIVPIVSQQADRFVQNYIQ